MRPDFCEKAMADRVTSDLSNTVANLLLRATYLYIGSISASPTACLLRGDASEAVILGTGTAVPAQ